MPVQNAEIAALFDQAAELLEIKGDNPFRSRAYRRAARLIEGLPKSVTSLLKAGEDLSELPGIGKDLAGKIAAIVTTGKFDLLESLKDELPGDLGEIAALPGLGPKRVKLLYDKLGVRSIEDLYRAAKAGRLRELRGFGPKSEAKLLAALAKPPSQKRFKLAMAEAEAEALVSFLRPGLDKARVVVAGSYRRRRDTVGDLDILVAAHRNAAAGDRLSKYENVANVLAHGPTRTTVVLRSGLQVDLRVVPEQSYGAALMYFTGSKAHNIALRALANERGWKLNEYGLFDGERQIAGATEEDVYGKLDLAFVPPELREDRGEVVLAKKKRLPKLVSLSDIRGDLHVHSEWSDGTVSIADMAAAARERGYAYMAITDHSQRVTIAHGLDPARLSRQIDEVDRLNDELEGFVVLKGVEVDILADGRLDLPNKILSRLDVVVAAVHYKFDLFRQAQTERIIRAMDNRNMSILAHPTARLIGEREPYDVDMERVIAAAHERGCHLEVNAEPERLDLTDVHAQAAKSMGVKVAISTDAHTTAALGYMRFGVDQARRGWLESGDVINTRPLGELKKLLKH
ncbi:DNA polymerase/3'-5' exonuclease PolX [Methylocella tundrae]|uniref:DNA polymerase beta n=1 Tax=Methylocella tundrae TaxID=227605 RepID=A0A4U8Z6C8_METTU|nr:DNA polymerase/3'-5' exonuclease PolX [Methylocella tundrae]WPP04677.1 DNA polymerase/3'-5' exonuclease PolX [Methylocella tundrae]VFU11136.1 DNA polymerase beta family protein [Methylocella tundrae]